MTSVNSLCLECPVSVSNVDIVENGCKELPPSDQVMSHTEEEDPKPKENWTENDLKEAIRRINAGEINFKEAENVYGISPRTIHRQRAIENMRAQLNPEKAKKLKSANNAPPKKDVTILRKPLEISCSTLGDVVGLLNTGTEEVKQLLNYECDLIYECKVCKNLFRSLVNFISHKRIYCCDLYSTIHTRTDENDDETPITDEERLKEKENIKEFTAKPYRVTCRKDLTAVLKRLKTMAELYPAEPILHMQTLDTTPCAFQQVLFTNEDDVIPPLQPVSESKENKEVVLPNAEVEKDKPVPLQKKDEKSTNPQRHFVAEKRFRCPVCLSNFTIKRSVLRHLKSVHHKSVEQVENLKSRIQVHFVRIKNGSGETNKEKTEGISSNTAAKTSEQKDSDGKECEICGHIFTTRSSYVSHLKSCKRNSSSSDTSSDNSPKPSVSLIPVISLTPIATNLYQSKSENEDNVEPPANTAKKTNSSNQSSKKVSLPLATSSNSHSKKIGIQVRMNYCKETTSAPNSASVTPTSYATSSIASSQSSDESSRRNSILSIIGCDEIPRIEPTVSHNTRSGSKLANILENLCDKRNRNEKPAVSEPEVKKKHDKLNATIYCNSCRKIYPLSDFSCNVTQPNITRQCKCAIRDCYFRSSDISKLTPHLSAKHSSLSENELNNMKSIFIAEFFDENGLNSLGDCKRRPIHHEKPDDAKNKKKTVVSDKNPPSHPSSSSTEKVTSSVSNSSSSKRKLPSNTKANVAKRKTTTDKESSNNDTPRANDIKIKTEEKSEISSNAVNLASFPTIGDIKIEKDDGNQTNELQNSKRPKKKKDDDNSSQPKKKKNIEDASVSTLPNGVLMSTSSSDEENDKAQVNPKLKVNHSKNIRKSNVPPIDPKLWKSPQKLNLTNLINDLSPSSSTPDSDLDQSVMSDENLKKSIMTIIFGKDMSAEKVEESVSNREKSPTSSSSSDCGKEKRYSFRIAKQGSQVKSVENKDDKTLKPSCQNKAKPSSR